MDKDATQIKAMFDQLAPRYNLMNRIMTFGMDQRWRRHAVRQARIQPGDKVLDLASGTGDIAFEVLKKHPETTIVAGDFSLGMLAQGKKRRNGDQLHWIACDAMNLPFADHSFDVAIFGYLLRNVADLNQTLKELHRVLKPGGRIVCLDTTPPQKSLLFPLINAYMNFGLKFFARTLSSDPAGVNYQYLCDSTKHFLPAKALAERFQQTGFSSVGYRTFNLRIIALHWGEKTTASRPHKNGEKG